jgi:hypothetical protein
MTSLRLHTYSRQPQRPQSPQITKPAPGKIAHTRRRQLWEENERQFCSQRQSGVKRRKSRQGDARLQRFCRATDGFRFVTLFTRLCDSGRGRTGSGRLSLPGKIANHEFIKSVWQSFRRLRCSNRFASQELVMANFGSGRCCQCDEEYVFQDGVSCARCLGLVYVPEDDQDTQETSSNIFLDHAAA